MSPRGTSSQREEFHRLAEGNEIVPVTRTLLADEVTPVSLFRALVPYSPAFLLESAEAGERVGRYSFIGAEPLATLRCQDGRATITFPEGERDFAATPFEALRQLIAGFRVAAPPGLPPFYGGAVGYVGYDAVRYLEQLPGTPVRDRDVPDAFFIVPRVVVALDHLQHLVTLVVHAPVGGGADQVYEQALEDLDRLEQRIRAGGAASTAGAPGSGSPPGPAATFTRAGYEAAVMRAKEYIRQGDVFQVVLSQRLARPLGAAPFEVYRALRSLNPSPYLFYLDFGLLQLIGSSPEMLVRVREHRVETRPIAGTRPRGADPAEDVKLEADLLADPKELAEHTMLVDLGRNDLGRVAAAGTVAVPVYKVVERYSHVMHLVSHVEGELAVDSDAVDALAACFPAGTLTGAPKVRAMEIIDELEPVRRGPYGGAVGYLSFSGDLDACIAIRTIVAADGAAYVQAGAGIVADSEPAREFEECENKARALLRALELAEGGLA